VKKTISQLTKKADELFSKFIRLRDSEDGEKGYCRTCGYYGEVKYMNAGHFQSRSHKGIRWDERNVHLQCGTCNNFRNGEQVKMARYIDEKYGEGTALELEGLRHLPAPTRAELEEIIEKYRPIKGFPPNRYA